MATGGLGRVAGSAAGAKLGKEYLAPELHKLTGDGMVGGIHGIRGGKIHSKDVEKFFRDLGKKVVGKKAEKKIEEYGNKAGKYITSKKGSEVMHHGRSLKVSENSSKNVPSSSLGIKSSGVKASSLFKAHQEKIKAAHPEFATKKKQEQLKARVKEQADGVELNRMVRKWGGFSHGKPFNYHYNIVANIKFDSANLMLLPIVEVFFDKVGVSHKDAYDYLVNADEHKYANELLNFSQENWDTYSYLYNTQDLQDRFVLGEVQGDVVVTFKLSQINQDNYNEVLQNLQHIVHNGEEGDWEVGGLILSINNKVNNIEDRIKITNSEIKPEHIYEVY